jgi:hypothetical protein
VEEERLGEQKGEENVLKRRGSHGTQKISGLAGTVAFSRRILNISVSKS